MDSSETAAMLAAMHQRHSVRMYTDEPVDADALATLRTDVAAVNAATGLHIQLAAGLHDAFMGYRTHYGRFKGVHNAIALIGPDRHDDEGKGHDAALELNVGYYGERLALRIIELGLSTAWAVLEDAHTGWWNTKAHERMIWALAFGHAARPGGAHHSKPMNALCSIADGVQPPDWFTRGMQAAMLAPTSLGQQPFLFRLDADGTVWAEATAGLFSHVGLGCARCHFDLGAAPERVHWGTGLPRLSADEPRGGADLARGCA